MWYSKLHQVHAYIIPIKEKMQEENKIGCEKCYNIFRILF